MSSTYKFGYAPDNVYGHTMALLRDLAPSAGLHLDVGCGYGALAEHVRELGLEYVGVDSDPDGIADLRARGFEAHVLDLEGDGLVERLSAVAGGRRLASISALDVLEHLTNDADVLDALRALAGDAVPLVISVPNVAHRDLALKLLSGRWEYTETGLLDRTHVVHHTESLLDAFARSAGWRQVGANDVKLEESDQFFPRESVILSPSSILGAYLRKIRDRCDSNAATVQLVRAYLTSTPRATPTFVKRDGADRPFLSVILRTQGRRPATLRDALLCLTAQTCDDFELLVLGHRLNLNEQLLVEQVIEEMPERIRTRTRLIREDRSGRAVPLNRGFAEAEGRYIAVLDDDDLVFGHWVEEFRNASRQFPNRILRSVAVEQDIERCEWPGGGEGFTTVSATRRAYPLEYDLYSHLTLNHSPLMTLAFPRGLYHELGMRFDERLNTCEDWDFEMRSALTCGVSSVREITAIYHKWKLGHSSYSLHTESEWKSDEAYIVSKLDGEPQLFPPGTVKLIREQQALIRKLMDGRPSPATWTPPPIAPDLPPPLRYRIADQMNSSLKRLPFVYRGLKRALSRGR